MTRKTRFDSPGAWYHVVNRAVARRSLFETAADIRHFLALLAWAVHRGLIEVHAYSIMTTHFHLLVRSPVGRLAEVMHWIQNTYVRTFNRGRKRDGPLLRGRYVAKLVGSLRYRMVLVAYIDMNAVKAGLAERPEDYPFGSAWHYAQPSGPPWLSREWVEEFVCWRLGEESYDPARYSESYGSHLREQAFGLVEHRLSSRARQAALDPFDDLIDAAPGRVLRWLRYKGQVADGCVEGLAVATPTRVLEVLKEGAQRGVWMLHFGRKSVSAWQVLEVGLTLRLSAATKSAVAERLGLGRNVVARLQANYETALATDLAFAKAAADLTREILAPFDHRRRIRAYGARHPLHGSDSV